MPGMPGEPGAQGLAGSPGSREPPGVDGSDGKDGTCPDSCLSSQQAPAANTTPGKRKKADQLLC
mgnify:FL=1